MTDDDKEKQTSPTVSGRSNVVSQPLPDEKPKDLVNESEISRMDIEDDGEVLKDLEVSKILKTNKDSVNFGELFPGQIVEETIIVTNCLLNKKVPFKIKVNCLTRELDDLDEYVYSMRRPSPNEVFNYNDTFLIVLAPKTMSSYRLAVKIPALKEPCEILGNIEISCSEAKGNPIIIPIRSKVLLPIIKLEKMIRLNSLKMSVLKLFMKNSKSQEFRVSLKNMVNSAVSVELQVLKHERYSKLDFTFYPQTLNLTPSVLSTFVLQVKNNLLESEIEDNKIKCVLMVKMKNGSAIFPFPVVVVFGE